jgi:hypothetical protein
MTILFMARIVPYRTAEDVQGIAQSRERMRKDYGKKSGKKREGNFLKRDCLQQEAAAEDSGWESYWKE